MKSGIIPSIAAVAVVLGGSVALPLSAHAGLSQCDSGKACGWLNRDLDALLYERGAKIASSSDSLSSANDRISSVANLGTKDVGWYTDPSLSGKRLCSNNGYYYNCVGKEYNDAFNSVQVYSNSSTC